MSQKRLQNDEQCIAEWRRLLGKFKSLISDEPAPENIKKELAALREEAKANPHLTYHQVSAILARCDNYLLGTFGSTKRIEHMNHTKTS
jgi:hypothetical protein